MTVERKVPNDVQTIILIPAPRIRAAAITATARIITATRVTVTPAVLKVVNYTGNAGGRVIVNHPLLAIMVNAIHLAALCTSFLWH